MTVLSGHTSASTAYVIADYPYGFRLRCQMHVWIETTKHGQRVVSQTSNPKRPGVWNKPKASTYSPIRVLYLDDQGYVQNIGLNLYTDPVKIAEFEATFAAALTSPRDQNKLAWLKLLNNAVADREAARKAVAV